MSTVSVIQSKIVDLTHIKYTAGAWRVRGYPVVFTNGCFDILHLGHARYLAEAASLGSYLIVGVNSDESVKRQGKGPNRPINNQDTRAWMVASLHAVDAVCIFNDDTPIELIKLVQPDVLVKGGDYDVNDTNSSSKKYIVGSDVVKARGGKVITIPTVEGFSTTSLIEKIEKK
jgi:rfaE bifunctional protein nucleotidyltransferase chain/domain